MLTLHPAKAPSAPTGDPGNRDRLLAMLGEWLREVSALLVVFPLIDQLVDEPARAHFDWWVALSPMFLGLILLMLGVALDPRRR